MGREDFTGIEALRNEAGVGIDAMDDYAAHVFVSTEDGAPIAAGRMYPVDAALRIDRLVSAKAYQDLPYEDLVLRILLYRARELSQEMVEVEPTAAIADLLPRFGFVAFGDANLMRCARDAIIWFSQCGD